MTTVDEIKRVCPWYFEMRDLEKDRPSRVPNGLGNGTSNVDTSLLGTEDEPDHGSDSDDAGDPSGDKDDGDYAAGAEEDDDERDQLAGNDSQPGPPDRWGYPAGKEDSDGDPGLNVSEDEDEKERLRKKARKEKKAAMKEKKPPKKTAARGSISTPAEKQPATSKSASDRFTELSMKEEDTAQRALELKSLRIKTEGNASAARNRLREKALDVKKEEKEMELRSQERIREMELANELKMQELKMKMGMGMGGMGPGMQPAYQTGYAPYWSPAFQNQGQAFQHQDHHNRQIQPTNPNNTPNALWASNVSSGLSSNFSENTTGLPGIGLWQGSQDEFPSGSSSHGDASSLGGTF